MFEWLCLDLLSKILDLSFMDEKNVIKKRIPTKGGQSNFPTELVIGKISDFFYQWHSDSVILNYNHHLKFSFLWPCCNTFVWWLPKFVENIVNILSNNIIFSTTKVWRMTLAEYLVFHIADMNIKSIIYTSRSYD